MAENNTQAGGTSNAGQQGGNHDGQGTNNNQNGDDKSQAKTFTQDELNGILSKRLAEEAEKSQKAINESVSKALEEERRVSQLSQKEKEAELERKRLEELNTKDTELTIRQNKLDFVPKLTEAKIPVSLLDTIVDKDPKVMEANFIKLKEAYTNAVKEGIAEELKGKTTTKDPLNNNSGGVQDIKRVF